MPRADGNATSMKSIPLLLLALTLPSIALAADQPAYKTESQAVSEIFTTTIVRLYSAGEGEHRFVAYVVTWKDREVVVTSLTPRHDDFAVGDTVRCAMRQSLTGPDPRTAGRMIFTLLGRPSEPVSARLLSDGAESQERLAAIAAEIDRRRAAREEARATPPAPKRD